MRICPRCRAIYSPTAERCRADGERVVEEHAHPLVGQVLERYRILEPLGEGTMGCVYRALHVVQSREYALKVLFADVAADQVLIERFRREAKAVSRMAHPNIVSVMDLVSPQVGPKFIVMELISGRTLEGAIAAEAPFSPVRAARIARQIAEGLGEAHRKGFVHRDVKPSNIMLADEEGREVVKILDFGTVGGVVPASSRLTSVGHIIGTPQYIAPEQIHDPSVGPAADLYALGVILFEMLSGEPPFQGSDPQQVLRKHITEAPPPLPPSEGLDLLAHWLLEKLPHQRPRGADDVIRAIERLGILAGQESVREQVSSRAHVDVDSEASGNDRPLGEAIWGGQKTFSSSDDETIRPEEGVAFDAARGTDQRDVPTYLIRHRDRARVDSVRGAGPATNRLPGRALGDPLDAPTDIGPKRQIREETARDPARLASIEDGPTQVHFKMDASRVVEQGRVFEDGDRVATLRDTPRDDFEAVPVPTDRMPVPIIRAPASDLGIEEARTLDPEDLPARHSNLAGGLAPPSDRADTLMPWKLEPAPPSERTRILEPSANAREIEGDLRATEADLRATEANFRATEADLRATEANFRATEADVRATETDFRATEADVRATEAGARETGASHFDVTSDLEVPRKRSPSTISVLPRSTARKIVGTMAVALLVFVLLAVAWLFLRAL